MTAHFFPRYWIDQARRYRAEQVTYRLMELGKMAKAYNLTALPTVALTNFTKGRT